MGILFRVTLSLEKFPIFFDLYSKELEVVERQKYPGVWRNPTASGIIHGENFSKNMSQGFLWKSTMISFL